MPCYDPDCHRSTREITEVEKKLNHRTSQLCIVLTQIEREHPEYIKELPFVILNWWDKHKEFDKNRKQ